MKVKLLKKKELLPLFKKNFITHKKFVFTFLKNPFKVGAVIPSSQKLAKTITEMSDLSTKNCVVELGPGTGVFTEKILKKIKPDTCFFCLELNLNFVRETQKRCPGVVVYHSSAEHIREYLSQNQKEDCDIVISGMPWTIFNNKTQEAIFNPIYDSLKPGGEFLTFVYITGMYLPGGISFSRRLKKKFKTIYKSKMIWNNFPPVFVYRCIK